LLCLAGVGNAHVRPHPLHCPVTRQEAEAYFHAPVELVRIKSLPRYLHRLPAVRRPVGGPL
jgi:hypothetical protein